MLRPNRTYKGRPNTTDMIGILTRVEAANQAVHREGENFSENVPTKEPDSDSGDVRDDRGARLAEREELVTYFHTYGVPLRTFPIHALRCILILRLRLRLDLAKYLLKDEIQAASLHPPLGQLVKFLRLPDYKLILPATNLPFPEKFVELLNILQPAER
ncbi:MAG: hypothetical protein Q9192_003981, partial [Flavoplaca navasiana]